MAAPSAGPVAAFLIDHPAPQRTPWLDELASIASVPVTILYREAEDRTRGWGPVEPAHPCAILPAGIIDRIKVVLRTLMRPEVRVFCSFGYRSPERVACILLARVRGLTLVLRSDSNIRDEIGQSALRQALKRGYLRMLLGPKAVIWAIGTANENYWRHYGFSHLVRIPYVVADPPVGTPKEGLEVRRQLGATCATTLVLYVGRLSADKGVGDLVEAFARVNRSSRAMTLALVGKGPEAPLLAERSRSDPAIWLLGPRAYKDLGPFYNAADVVVVPSRVEPWNWVVDEALANGAPVIASDRVGSADDLVSDDRGMRYPAGDVNALAACLERVARGEILRSERGWRQQADVATKMAQALEAAELAASRSRRVRAYRACCLTCRELASHIRIRASRQK